MSGKLIVLEGLDGSGKATQTVMLCDALAKHGIKQRHISFPDYEQPSSALVKMYLGGEFGKNPDDVNAYAASSFYAVDRFASYSKLWRDDYQNGTTIVADRYTTSNLVYQLSKLSKIEWDGFIDWVQDFEYGKLGLPQPSITLYLDMPPLVSQDLLNARYHGDTNKKDIHESNVAYLDQCRESAAYAASRLGWQVIKCADGNHPKSIEQIHSECMKIVMGDSHFIC